MLKNPVFAALDVPVERVPTLVDQLAGVVGGIKLGHQFLFQAGIKALEDIHAKGCKTFLDIKFKDIPDRIATELTALVPYEPYFVTLHADGGHDMLAKTAEQVANEAARLNVQKPKLLAITVLTSMDQTDLDQIGIERQLEGQVMSMARLAKDSGVDGVVASAKEAKMLREEFGPDFLIVTPGIRPSTSTAEDQKRVVTPADAIRMGVDYMVIGRPITKADDPRAAAEAIWQDIQAAQSEAA